MTQFARSSNNLAASEQRICFLDMVSLFLFVVTEKDTLGNGFRVRIPWRGCILNYTPVGDTMQGVGTCIIAHPSMLTKDECQQNYF